MKKYRNNIELEKNLDNDLYIIKLYDWVCYI